MRDGFGPGARGVDVGGGVGAEDAEGGGGEALGREVDVGAGEGGGGGEEEGLGEGPGVEGRGDGGVEFYHFWGDEMWGVGMVEVGRFGVVERDETVFW